jgi:acyl transferase domain-containing protein
MTGYVTHVCICIFLHFGCVIRNRFQGRNMYPQLYKRSSPTLNPCVGIVAGCNIIYSLDMTMSLSNMGFLSPDGVCHSFDHRANGYARGEGFGVVIIKPLSHAVRDSDTIRAVLRGTGTNQDGNTPLAQPNQDAQQQLIADTYRTAGLPTSDTRYVEAHGNLFLRK